MVCLARSEGCVGHRAVVAVNVSPIWSVRSYFHCIHRTSAEDMCAHAIHREDTVHESSYLPFIYQTNTVGSSDEQTQERPKFRGRRTFNAKGVEVVAEEVGVSSASISFMRPTGHPSQNPQRTVKTPPQRPQTATRSLASSSKRGRRRYLASGRHCPHGPMERSPAPKPRRCSSARILLHNLRALYPRRRQLSPGARGSSSPRVWMHHRSFLRRRRRRLQSSQAASARLDKKTGKILPPRRRRDGRRRKSPNRDTLSSFL